jgi:hypothetical protein
MFISIEEKKTIVQKIDGLTTQCERIATELIGLMSKIKVLEQKLSTQPKPVKEKKQMTALQKAKQRVYQMEYKQRMKAKKLAEQGKTDVSA